MVHLFPFDGVCSLGQSIEYKLSLSIRKSKINYWANTGDQTPLKETCRMPFSSLFHFGEAVSAGYKFFEIR